MYVRSALAMMILACLALSGCGGGRREDPILQLSAEEALEQGKALMAEKKYRLARKYLIHAYEVEPNSASGREGLLMAADALFYQDSHSGYVEAESRYRDFLNRFPTSNQASYAQYRIAGCLAQRVGRPDRDQETARQALSEYQDVIRIYPTSQYAAAAREEMVDINNTLAEHEFKVGAFYLRFGLPASAADRFEGLLTDYPEYTEPDKILFFLCRAYEKAEQPENAAEACRRLREEFPDSRFAQRVPDRKKEPSRNGENSAADVAANGGL